MQSNRYGGKRVYRGRKSSAGSDSTIFLKAVGRVLFSRYCLSTWSWFFTSPWGRT